MSDNEENRPVSFTVIGLEGAGKTVFLTTWSTKEKFSSENNFIISAKNSHVLKYINKNWETLQSGEWPASTPQSAWTELGWKLQTDDGQEAVLDTIDLAGHDVRKLFSNTLDELFQKYKELNNDEQYIIETLDDSDVIFLLINLKNTSILGHSKRAEDEGVLLNIFNFAMEYGRRIVPVFTQWSDCEAWVNDEGGIDNVLCKLMPDLYSAILMEARKESSLYLGHLEVTSVVETEAKSVSTGVYKHFPCPNFSSQGLEDFSEILDFCVKLVFSIREMHDANNSSWFKKVLDFFKT